MHIIKSNYDILALGIYLQDGESLKLKSYNKEDAGLKEI